MAWTLCVSGAAFFKAGVAEDVIVANVSGADLTILSNEAESILSDIARVDLVTNYSNFTANGVNILSQLSSNMIGQKIAVKLRGQYSSQREFETVLDVIENDMRRGLELIKDDKIKTYLSAT